MTETGGYIPSEAQQPANLEQAAVLKAIGESGQPLEQIARDAGLTPDGAQAALGWVEQVRRDNPGVNHERVERVDDGYSPPSLQELVFGSGGNTLRPLYSAQSAGQIDTNKDYRTLAETGMPSMLEERQSLKILMEQAVTGVDTDRKALSVRIVEITHQWGDLQKALAMPKGPQREARIAQITAGLDPLILINKADELGLLATARTRFSTSEAHDLRQPHKDGAAGQISDTVLAMTAGFERYFKKLPAPQNAALMMHLEPKVAHVFGHHMTAHAAVPPAMSAAPVAGMV